MNETESNKPKPKRWPDIVLGLSLLLFVVAAWFVYRGWILSAEMPQEGMTQRGLFGDMFGGLNTLFSGLAFAGIIFTVYLQMKELALQREELEQTRVELKRAADANTTAAQALGKQIQNQLLAAKISGTSALLASADAAIAGELKFLTSFGMNTTSKNDLLKERDRLSGDLIRLLNEAMIHEME